MHYLKKKKKIPQNHLNNTYPRCTWCIIPNWLMYTWKFVNLRKSIKLKTNRGHSDCFLENKWYILNINVLDFIIFIIQKITYMYPRHTGCIVPG